MNTTKMIEYSFISICFSPKVKTIHLLLFALGCDSSSSELSSLESDGGGDGISLGFLSY